MLKTNEKKERKKEGLTEQERKRQMGERRQKSCMVDSQGLQLDIGHREGEKKTARSGKKSQRQKRKFMTFTSHQQYQFTKKIKHKGNLKTGQES